MAFLPYNMGNYEELVINRIRTELCSKRIARNNEHIENRIKRVKF